MNRPKLEHYWNDGLVNHEDDYKDYLEDLDKYCDELEQRCLSDEWNLSCLDKDCKNLEKENKRLKNENDFAKNVQTPDYEKVQTELWKYQKALDEAGKFIDEITQSCPKDMYDFDVRCDECDDDSKWCWKEWLMKND